MAASLTILQTFSTSIVVPSLPTPVREILLEIVNPEARKCNQIGFKQKKEPFVKERNPRKIHKTTSKGG